MAGPIGGTSGADAAGTIAFVAGVILAGLVVAVWATLGQQPTGAKVAFTLSVLAVPVALHLAVRALLDPRTRFAGACMAFVLLLGAGAGWIEGHLFRALVDLTLASAVAVVVGVAVTLATGRRP